MWNRNLKKLKNKCFFCLFFFQVSDFASVIGSVDALLKRKGFEGLPLNKYVDSLLKKYSEDYKIVPLIIH